MKINILHSLYVNRAILSPHSKIPICVYNAAQVRATHFVFRLLQNKKTSVTWFV